jgi:hypothetical protein
MFFFSLAGLVDRKQRLRPFIWKLETTDLGVSGQLTVVEDSASAQ